MFIAANTRRSSTASSVFEFDLKWNFSKYYQVCNRQVFPYLATYVTIEAKTSQVHTSDSAWLTMLKLHIQAQNSAMIK